MGLQRNGRFESVASILALAVIGFCPDQAHADDDATATATAIIDAHLANLDSFEQFTCRYTRAFTRAKTIEDALAGRYSEPPRVAKIMWARDGRKHTLKVVEDEVTTRIRNNPNPKKFKPVSGQPTVMFGEPVPFITEESLFEGDHTLIFTPARPHPSHPAGGCMWGEGMRHQLGRLMLFYCEVGGRKEIDELRDFRDDVARGAVKVVDVSRVQEGGRELVKLSLDYTGTPRHDAHQEYWFAPDQGYLLVRKIQSGYPNDKAGNVYHVEWLDARPCPKGRWFPGRILWLVQQNHYTDWQVYEDTRVTELEVDKKPNRELFEIVIPARTGIVEFNNGARHNLLTSKRERVHVDDLPRIWMMMREKAENPLMDTAIHPTRSYRWAWWAAGSAVGLCAVAGIGYRVRTVRRRAGAGAA